MPWIQARKIMIRAPSGWMFSAQSSFCPINWQLDPRRNYYQKKKKTGKIRKIPTLSPFTSIRVGSPPTHCVYHTYTGESCSCSLHCSASCRFLFDFHSIEMSCKKSTALLSNITHALTPTEVEWIGCGCLYAHNQFMEQTMKKGHLKSYKRRIREICRKLHCRSCIGTWMVFVLISESIINRCNKSIPGPKMLTRGIDKQICVPLYHSSALYKYTNIPSTRTFTENIKLVSRKCVAKCNEKRKCTATRTYER